jgi:hypothetical protein
MEMGEWGQGEVEKGEEKEGKRCGSGRAGAGSFWGAHSSSKTAFYMLYVFS